MYYRECYRITKEGERYNYHKNNWEPVTLYFLVDKSGHVLEIQEKDPS